LKIAIVQTAFLGDVILMTSMIETIKAHNEKAKIYVVVRSENAAVLANNEHIEKVFAFEKRHKKIKNLFVLIKKLRFLKLDVVFNCHRYFSSGLMSILCGARTRVGFDKNPFAFFYTKKVAHFYKNDWHELDRNQSLLEAYFGQLPAKKPKLYPSLADFEKVRPFVEKPFVVIAPSSVWATKQYPIKGWIDLIEQLEEKVYLVGGPNDVDLCEAICEKTNGKALNLAGKLTLLQSAALFKYAVSVYANDSAPTHIATAMNVETHTVFCSTTPYFGFGPKADIAFVHQSTEPLTCRPCGIHGKKSCPEKHFSCANFSLETTRDL